MHFTSSLTAHNAIPTLQPDLIPIHPTCRVSYRSSARPVSPRPSSPGPLSRVHSSARCCPVSAFTSSWANRACTEALLRHNGCRSS